MGSNAIYSIPLIGSLNFSMRYFQNPATIIPLLLGNGRKIRMKGSKSIEIELEGKEDLWKLKNLMAEGWKLIGAEKDILYVKRDNITVAVPPYKFGVLREPLLEYHVFDYSNATVLDVGGYIGYSSVLFTKWGAKKVIVYEVQRENIPLIRKNMELNGVRGEVYNIGVAENDGEIEPRYRVPGSTTVGLDGDKTYRVRAISARKVLTQHRIDIAKFDCEGCEYSLLSVPCNILRNVPNYVMEYHKGSDRLKRKFESCGYEVSPLWKINNRVGGLKTESKH